MYGDHFSFPRCPPHLSARLVVLGAQAGVAGACYVALLDRFGVLPDCNEGERSIGRWRALVPQSPQASPSRRKKGGGDWEGPEGGIMKPQGCEPRDAEICKPSTRVKRTPLTWVLRRLSREA